MSFDTDLVKRVDRSGVEDDYLSRADSLQIPQSRVICFQRKRWGPDPRCHRDQQEHTLEPCTMKLPNIIDAVCDEIPGVSFAVRMQFLFLVSSWRAA